MAAARLPARLPACLPARLPACVSKSRIVAPKSPAKSITEHLAALLRLRLPPPHAPILMPPDAPVIHHCHLSTLPVPAVGDVNRSLWQRRSWRRLRCCCSSRGGSWTRQQPRPGRRRRACSWVRLIPILGGAGRQAGAPAGAAARPPMSTSMAHLVALWGLPPPQQHAAAHGALCSHRHRKPHTTPLPPPPVHPVRPGLLNTAAILSLGGTTGPALNPARDLGPRLAFHLLPIPERCPARARPPARQLCKTLHVQQGVEVWGAHPGVALCTCCSRCSRVPGQALVPATFSESPHALPSPLPCSRAALSGITHGCRCWGASPAARRPAAWLRPSPACCSDACWQCSRWQPRGAARRGSSHWYGADLWRARKPGQARVHAPAPAGAALRVPLRHHDQLCLGLPPTSVVKRGV